MGVNKEYNFDSLIEKAEDAIFNIQADNVGKSATLPASMQGGAILSNKTITNSSYYGVNKLTTKGANGTHNVFTFKSDLKTVNNIPEDMLKGVDRLTVKSQFQKLLKNRELSQAKFAGKLISIRTVQAVAQTMIDFIVARFQIWTDPVGSAQLILYNSGTVSYPSLSNYTYKIVEPGDTLDQAGAGDLLGSLCVSALKTLNVQKQEAEATYTSSSSSSSCSSSCSSSSCSSSCSSSSSSSTFIAYMKLSL